MLIAIVILSLILIRSIFINVLDKRLIKHQQEIVESYRVLSKTQTKAHRKFVSDYYKMYCTHQKDLLLLVKRLAEKHSDEDSKDDADLAILELARLKEIHLDKYIEEETEHA
jgi:hypothetical protein